MKPLSNVQHGLVILIVALPVWSFGGTGFFVPWFALAAGVALGLLSLIGGRRDGRWTLPKPSVVWFMAAMLAGAAWAAVAGGNARARFLIDEFSFQALPHLSFLPASFDGAKSWDAALKGLASAAVFWGICGFCGLADGSTRGRQGDRSRFVLWVLGINGVALAFVGMLARFDAPDRFLWIREVSGGYSSEASFGPFRYRGNAATVLNLIWPLVLIEWWRGHRDRSGVWARDPTILFCAVLVFVAVWGTGSRGGWIVSVLQLVVIVVWLLRRASVARFKSTEWLRNGLAIAAVAVGFLLSVDLEAIKDRLGAGTSSWVVRWSHWTQALPMFFDYPWFGVGPGAFDVAFSAYDQSDAVKRIWVRNTHCDPLQTLVTYGGLGTGMMWACVVAWWVRLAPLRSTATFLAMVSVLGAVLHSFVDLPFQVFGVQLSIVQVAAYLTPIGSADGPPSLKRA